MSKPPEVSVVVPTYNRAEIIARAISSVFDQTLQDLEIIVVDDGSTDNTIYVIQKIDDPRLRVIRHPKNLGVSAARNTGMRAAKGDFIAWLDTDDEWLPEKLETQVAALKNAPGNILVSCTGYYKIIEEKERLVIPFSPGPWFRTLLLRCELPGPVILFNRSILDEIGYLDESLRRYEDWDWLIRYAKKFDILIIEEPLLRHYPSTDSSPRTIEESALSFISKHQKDFNSFGWYFRRRALARRWADIATAYYLGQEDEISTKKYIMRTISTNPISNLEIYFGLFDLYFGTRLFDKALNTKDSFISLLYKKQFQKLWS